MVEGRCRRPWRFWSRARLRLQTGWGIEQWCSRSTLSRASGIADPRLHSFVFQLEGILQQSAQGRTQLAGTVRSVRPSCGSASPTVQQQLTGVIDNRNGQLEALGPGPDSATQTASSLLDQALAASTQADVQYRLWAGALASAPADQCSTDPSAASALAAAHAYDSSGTTLKGQFVALFDPLAAQVGLPAWSQADF